jgi:hypothetical protein
VPIHKGWCHHGNCDICYYSAIKKNETVSFVGKWIELEIIMLSKISRFRNTNVEYRSEIHFAFCGGEKGKKGEEKRMVESE